MRAIIELSERTLKLLLGYDIYQENEEMFNVKLELQVYRKYISLVILRNFLALRLYFRAIPCPNFTKRPENVQIQAENIHTYF